MTLISRLCRFLQADMHAMLDQLEAPDLILKQSIREMEEVLADESQHILDLKKQQQRLKQRETSAVQLLAEIEQQLDICFSARQNNLARFQIKRKLEIQQLIKTVATDQTLLEDELENRITDHECKCLQLEGLRHQAEVLLNKADNVDADLRYKSGRYTVRDEDVEIAFLNEQSIRRQS
ncbi:MAG TPA: hypothetical protein ENJ32_05385 [Crenotrichaceae bacterium]|nr:hypothetical protein [Crenotrichaceae bacterium]